MARSWVDSLEVALYSLSDSILHYASAIVKSSSVVLENLFDFVFWPRAISRYYSYACHIYYHSDPDSQVECVVQYGAGKPYFPACG